MTGYRHVICCRTTYLEGYGSQLPGRIRSLETSNGRIVLVCGAAYYSLCVALSPAQKAKVETRDVADPFVEATATRFDGLTQTTVPVKVKTRFCYESVGDIRPDLVRHIIYNGYYGGVYNIVKETGFWTWRCMGYLPVPVPEKSPRKAMAPEAKDRRRR